MKEKPPSIIQQLRYAIEHGTDEEARVAQLKLTEILSKGGRNAAAKNRENKARTEAIAEDKRDALIKEYIDSLLEAGAHLAPLGDYPSDIEELLKPYRID